MRRFILFRLVASLLAIAVFCLASLPAAAAREGTPGVPARASPPVSASPVRPGDAIPGWAGTPAASDAAISSVLASAISVAAGGSHTCAVTAGGGVKCWGANYAGQLGDNTLTNRTTPMDVSSLASGVIGVATGQYHTCAVTAGGGVKCWGYNGRGQLGDGTTTDRLTPVDVSGLGSGVSALAAGAEHTCAVMDAIHGGGVKCWGYNGYGQLGDGTTIGRTTPVDVNGLGSGVSVVAAGRYHTCVMTAGGVKCWGGNSNGQLGDGTTQSRTTPVDVSGLGSGVSAVAAGESHTCAVMDAVHGGGVKCWGYNRFGQLGDGTTTDHLVPVDVSGLANGVSAVAAGRCHSCAMKAEGGVKCWGFNILGQLGDGTAGDRSVPTDVSGLASGVSGVAAGGDHTCAVLDTVRGGGLKCWGNNGSGQLGNGTTDKHTTPVEVSGLASGVNVVAAGQYHTCAVTAGGGLKCWGLNFAGQLGDGTTAGHAIPMNVSGLVSGVSDVAAGDSHTCAVTAGGAVKCWGNNSPTPVDVSGLGSGVIGVAAGSGHTCAVTAGGVKCWGDNSSGQLGDGTTDRRTTPVDVSGLASGVTAVAAGDGHTCAVTAGGAVKCWGSNGFGQLGDGTTDRRTTPVDVSGLTSGVSSIAAGAAHTCAVMDAVHGGGVKCWGDNYRGQLGNGTTGNRSVPVDVSGLASGGSAVTAGEVHTCALMDAVHGGGVKCWGNNSAGQLGDGTTGNRSVPVDVSGLASGGSGIAAGEVHTCALMDAVHGGGVKCWGYNGYGQLGAIPSGWTPVDVIGFGGPTRYQYLPIVARP